MSPPPAGVGGQLNVVNHSVIGSDLNLGRVQLLLNSVAGHQEQTPCVGHHQVTNARDRGSTLVLGHRSCCFTTETANTGWW